MFNYFDNPMRIFQDEETEAYLGVICPRLRVCKRSGQGTNPDGAPCALTMLIDEVFYDLSLARQNSHFCCLWLEWGVSLGVQAADLLFFTSSHVAGLCAWSM